MTVVTFFALDWLSFTVKGISDTAVAAALSFGLKPDVWVDVKAVHGYKLAIQHPFGHIVMSNPGRPEMGTHVMMGGACMSKLTELEYPTLSLLAWVLKEGGKIARLDLAIDLRETPIDIIGLTRCQQVKGHEGSAQKWNLITGSDNGVTLYVGSRKSEKFMRIYNKAAQQKLDGIHWARFELELKAETAREIAAAISLMPSGEIPRYVKGLMKGLYNPGDAVYAAAMDADAVYVGSTKNTSDSTIEWLLNTVAKTLARQMTLHSDTDLWGEFIRSVHANLRALGHEPPDEE